MAQSAKKRDARVDLVKAAAILGVILIHVDSGGLNLPPGSFGWFAALFWGVLPRPAVALFLMCSGVLFLDPAREVPGRRLFTRYIPRLTAAMLFWAMGYKVFHLLAGGDMSAGALLRSAGEVLLFDQEIHFYFIHLMLLFYVLVPILRVFVRNAARETLLYALGVWFVLGILFPTLLPFRPFSLLAPSPVMWSLNSRYAAPGYALLGYYLHRYGLPRRWAALSAGVGFLIAAVGTCALSFRDGVLREGFLEGMSVGVCLMAAGLFALAGDVSARLSPRMARAAAKLSQASFCVYLVHLFFLHALAALDLTAERFFPLLSVPLLSLLIYALSLLVYAVLSRLPVINRWLI